MVTCVCENGFVYPDGDRELHSVIPDPAHLPRGRLLRFVSGQSLWITPALCQLPATDIRGECYRTVLGQSSSNVCITLLLNAMGQLNSKLHRSSRWIPASSSSSDQFVNGQSNRRCITAAANALYYVYISSLYVH